LTFPRCLRVESPTSAFQDTDPILTFVTSLVIASKFLTDNGWSHRPYRMDIWLEALDFPSHPSSSGLWRWDIKQLCDAERMMCSMLGWDLWVRSDVVVVFAKRFFDIGSVNANASGSMKVNLATHPAIRPPLHAMTASPPLPSPNPPPFTSPSLESPPIIIRPAFAAPVSPISVPLSNMDANRSHSLVSERRKERMQQREMDIRGRPHTAQPLLTSGRGQFLRAHTCVYGASAAIG
jgi:hypothetical protein